VVPFFHNDQEITPAPLIEGPTGNQAEEWEADRAIPEVVVERFVTPVEKWGIGRGNPLQVGGSRLAFFQETHRVSGCRPCVLFLSCGAVDTLRFLRQAKGDRGDQVLLKGHRIWCVCLQVGENATSIDRSIEPSGLWPDHDFAC